MMIADIKQGIIDKLAETFPSVTIYAEKVPQNFQEPSFRVKTITATERSEMGTRRWREIPFDILYFPESEDEPETEWQNVVERLFQSVEWITAGGDLMRGTDMSGDYDIEQEVGHFKITFGAYLIEKHEKGDLMETLMQNGG